MGAIEQDMILSDFAVLHLQVTKLYNVLIKSTFVYLRTNNLRIG